MIDVGKIYCGRSSTGVGIGTMRPDQFWQDYAFGNIRDSRFGDNRLDESEPLMHGLKHKADSIKGRCRHCQYRAMGRAPCGCGDTAPVEISGRLNPSAV